MMQSAQFVGASGDGARRRDVISWPASRSPHPALPAPGHLRTLCQQCEVLAYKQLIQHSDTQNLLVSVPLATEVAGMDCQMPVYKQLHCVVPRLHCEAAAVQ